jgi:hypothetical protein
MSLQNDRKNDWLVPTINPGLVEYENKDRAKVVHAQWMVGFAECEIAAFFGITEADVRVDLQWIQGQMSPRQLSAQSNDRTRLQIQREQSAEYNRLLKESLTVGAKEWLLNGLSPAGILKEYREAVGLTEKPGGIAISFTKNTANFGGGGTNAAGGIRSAEDMIRRVIELDPECGLTPIDDSARALPDDVTDIESEEDTEDQP